MIRPGGKGLEPFLADGYLKQGSTVKDLALQLKVPVDALQATVARFNTMAQQGSILIFNEAPPTTNAPMVTLLGQGPTLAWAD
jgi:hypothetical protein